MFEKKCSQLTCRKPLVSTRHHSPWSSTAGPNRPPSRTSKLDVVLDSDPALTAAMRKATRLTTTITPIAYSVDSRLRCFTSRSSHEGVGVSGIPEAYPAGMEAHTAAGISLSGLSKTFRGPNGPVHAVRDVDVEIEHGETVALLGPNGAGKSTTIDMMLGLLPPDARHGLAVRAATRTRRSRQARSGRCSRPASSSATSACASSSP